MPNPPNLPPSEVTPEDVFLNRRKFMKTAIWVGSTITTSSIYQTLKPAPKVENTGKDIVVSASPSKSIAPTDELSRFQDIAGYNNFYEFSTQKSAVAAHAPILRYEAMDSRSRGVGAKPHCPEFG